MENGFGSERAVGITSKYGEKWVEEVTYGGGVVGVRGQGGGFIGWMRSITPPECAVTRLLLVSRCLSKFDAVCLWVRDLSYVYIYLFIYLHLKIEYWTKKSVPLFCQF